MAETELRPHARLMSAKELALYIGRSPPTIRRMIERGELPKGVEWGGRLAWDRQVIDRVIDKRFGRRGYDDPDEALDREERNVRSSARR